MGSLGLKYLYAITLGIGFLGTNLVFAYIGSKEAFGFGIGSGILFLNYLSLAFVLRAVFYQKSVVFAGLLIFSKYIILGIFLYLYSLYFGLSLEYIAYGYSSIIISGPLAAVIISKGDFRNGSF